MHCDCGHHYLDHAQRPKDGAFCGGLECEKQGCPCESFHNATTREIERARKEGRL